MAKLVAAVLAALVASVGTSGFGAALESANAGLGAGSKVIAACGNGMGFAYTSGYYAESSGYVVNRIDLSNIPAGCRNKNLSVTFYDNSGATVGAAVDATLAATGTTQSIAVTPGSNTIDVREVRGVSVVAWS
jgi:hypothetical protein